MCNLVLHACVPDTAWMCRWHISIGKFLCWFANYAPVGVYTKTRVHVVSAQLIVGFGQEKNNEAGNSLNAVEHEPVPTRVLNPNASEASYKLKQRSYRKTNLKKKVLTPKRWRRNVPDPEFRSASYNVFYLVSLINMLFCGTFHQSGCWMFI